MSLISYLCVCVCVAGVNGQLEYSIAGGDEKSQFSISDNGTIFTRAPLDREDQSFYNLVVRASDLASPPLARLSSTVQVSCGCPYLIVLA